MAQRGYDAAMHDGHGSAKKFLYLVALAGVAWLIWAAVHDTDGRFDPSMQWDVIEYRVGYRMGDLPGDANREIDRQNRGMQKVFNDHDRRIERQSEEHTD